MESSVKSKGRDVVYVPLSCKLSLINSNLFGILLMFFMEYFSLIQTSKINPWKYDKKMISNYIHWNPDPEIINIFGISLRYYGLLFATGLMLSLSILSWMYKRENLPPRYLETLAIYGMIGIVAGARLGHCLFYEPSYYLSHPLEMIFPITFQPGGGIAFTGYRGLASHGGGLGLVLAMFFYSRKTGHSMLDVADKIAVVMGLAGGFIRSANLMNSEIIGIPTTKPWGFIFDNIDAIPRHPAQLYEALSYFFIFAVMMLLYIGKKDRVGKGFFTGLVLVLVFIARFFIEFVKENQVGFEQEMILNMGQLLSLPFIVVGIGFIIYSFKRKKRENNEPV